MRNSLLTFIGFFLSLFLTDCSHKMHSSYSVIQGDTLRVTTENKKDTTIKHFVRLDGKNDENYDDTSIYHTKPIDTTIAVSNFYFTSQNFKIYFDSKSVISFCDSTITNTPADSIPGYLVNWGTKESMKELRRTAGSNEHFDIMVGDWLPTLLDRFDPLIIDTKTNENAKLLLIETFRNRYEGHVAYYAITKQNDTLSIWYQQDFWNVEPKSATIKNGR